MSAQQISRISSNVVLILSLTALITVLCGYTVPRGTVEGDEGTGAHIFQLSIASIIPAVLVFLISADWKRPRQNALRLAIPMTALIVAFAALYYLEHNWLGPR